MANLYRIGDFAEKLGVTPDMLKYCEKKGIISSVKTENGYRYYDFGQSANVIEYMKLQNQGFSADEIYSALHAASFAELAGLENSLQGELEKKMHYCEALIERNRRIQQLKDRFSGANKWLLSQRTSAFFLPHADDRILTNDRDIHGRVEQWNAYLPVVESACRISEQSSSLCWGYYIEEKYARLFGLDVSNPVYSIPERLVLEVYISRSLNNKMDHACVVANELPEKLGLHRIGDAYHRVIAKMWIGDERKEYSILNIPVEHI